MGHLRHESAATTFAVRSALQRSQASFMQPSRDADTNPKTVANWRKRSTVEDMRTGPTEPRLTALSEAEETTVAHVKRSAVHRCVNVMGSRRVCESLKETSPEVPPVSLTPASFRFCGLVSKATCFV